MTNLTVTETNNIFELATIKKLRFQSKRGNLTVEDLWDIPLKTTVKSDVSLDEIAVELQKTLQSSVVSFVDKDSKDDVVTVDNKLRFEIVIYIIEKRVAMGKQRKLMNERKAELETFQSILRSARIEQLKSLSVEELEAKIKLLSETS